MSVTEACTLLGISRPALYRRIKDHRLTPLPKVNPVRDREPLRFSRADVERLKAPAAPRDGQGED